MLLVVPEDILVLSGSLSTVSGIRINFWNKESIKIEQMCFMVSQTQAQEKLWNHVVTYYWLPEMYNAEMHHDSVWIAQLYENKNHSAFPVLSAIPRVNLCKVQMARNSFEKQQKKKNFQTDWVFSLAAQVPASALWVTEEHFWDPESSRPPPQWGKVGFRQRWCGLETEQEGTSRRWVQVFRSAAAGRLNSRVQSDLTSLPRTGSDGRNGPSLSVPSGRGQNNSSGL